MDTVDVVVVRVYLSEDQARSVTLLKRLQEWARIRGATLFHGDRGFGSHGDGGAVLPAVLEFFEAPEKAEEAMALLDRIVEPGHVVSWPATLRVRS